MNGGSQQKRQTRSASLAGYRSSFDSARSRQSSARPPSFAPSGTGAESQSFKWGASEKVLDKSSRTRLWQYPCNKPTSAHCGIRGIDNKHADGTGSDSRSIFNGSKPATRLPLQCNSPTSPRLVARVRNPYKPLSPGESTLILINDHVVMSSPRNVDMLVSRLYAKASEGWQDGGHVLQSHDGGGGGVFGDHSDEDGCDGDARRGKDLESVKQEQKGMFHRLSYLYQKVCVSLCLCACRVYVCVYIYPYAHECIHVYSVALSKSRRACFSDGRICTRKCVCHCVCVYVVSMCTCIHA
jgi:hypothetical protein